MYWRVVAGKADPEMFAVEGEYLVADNLPIENANLIAAAPDLFELIKRANEADSHNDNIRTAWWEERAEAIAKATASQP